MPDKNLTLDIYESMGELPASAVNLLQQVQSPFLDYDWFHSFSEFVCHALGEEKWLTLSEAGEAVALLPMIAQKRGRYRVLQSMSNYYTPYFDIVSPAFPREHSLTNIVSAAIDFFNTFDIVEVLPTCEDVKNSFLRAFGSSSWTGHCYEHSTNWRECGISDFASYWEERPSRLKTTIVRRRRKLEKMPHEFKIFSGELPDQALADYHEVYFKSWKNNEPFPAFIDAISTSASLRKILRLGILYIDGRPAAAQLWFVSDDTAFILKLAYDPQYQSLSAGTLLSAVLFKHVIEQDRVTIIDYLTGSDPYKADWMNEKRALSGIQFTNSHTYRGKLATIKNRAGRMFQKTGLA